MKKKVIYDIKDILKETKDQRNNRLDNTRRTYTKIIKPRKGKGSYDRSNNKNI